MLALGMGSATAASYVDVLVNHDAMINGQLGNSGLAGGEFTYRAKVKLNGGDDVTGVTLIQKLPVGAILMSVKPAEGKGITCKHNGSGIKDNVLIDQTNDTIECVVPSLTIKDDFKWVDFNVVLPTAKTDWKAVASARLSGDGAVDHDPTNNVDIDRHFTVTPAVDLVVKLKATKTNVKPDEDFDYVIDVSSRGPMDIPSTGNVRLEFDVPAGAEIRGVAPLPAGWSCGFDPAASFPVRTGKYVCDYTAGVTGASFLQPVTLPSITLHATATMSGPIGATASVAAYNGAGTARPMPDAQTVNNVSGVVVTSSGTGYVDLSLKKTVSPSVLDAQATDSEVVYTLTPAREGGAGVPQEYVVVTDTLPDGVEFVGMESGLDKGWTCSFAKPQLTCQWQGRAGQDYFPFENHKAMPSIAFRATVQHAAVGDGSLRNAAEVKLTHPDQAEPNIVNNKASADITLSNTAQLKISKSVSGKLVQVNAPFSYNVVVSNDGPMDVLPNQPLVVTEKPGPGLMLTSAPTDWQCLPGVFPSDAPQECTYLGGLAAKKSHALTFGAIVPALPVGSSADYAVFGNEVEADLPGSGRDTIRVSSTDSVTVSNEKVSLTVRKKAIKWEPVDKISPPPGTQGQRITYELKVTNDSTDPKQIARLVRVSDVLDELVLATDGIKPGDPEIYPGGGYIKAKPTTNNITCDTPQPEVGRTRVLVCMIAELPAGESATVEVTIIPRVKRGTWVNGVLEATPYDNTVNARSQVIVGLEGSDTATEMIDALTNIDVVKNVGPQQAAAGQVVKYDVTVSNRGPSFAENVTMEDVLPINAILVGEPTTANGQCTYRDANGQVHASADGQQGGSLDCAWGDALDVGHMYLVSYYARSVNDIQLVDTLTNTVTVATSTPEITLADNTAVAQVTLKPAELDVSVQMGHTEDGLALGQETVYTVTVSNAGYSVATNVLMEMLFPQAGAGLPSTATFEYMGIVDITGESNRHYLPPGAVSGDVHNRPMVSPTYANSLCQEPPIPGTTSGTLRCTIPLIGPGEFVKFQIRMKAVDLPPGANTGSFFPAASVAATEQQEYLSYGDAEVVAKNNATGDRTSANRNAVDLGIVKTGPGGQVFEGDKVTYTLTVTNHGRGNGLSPVGMVSDVLPQGLLFESATGGQGCSYDAANRTVNCVVPEMRRLETTVFTLVAQLDVPYTGQRPLVNTARVTAPGDGDPENNESTTTTTIEPPPTKDFGIDKSGPSAVLNEGDEVTYTLTVTNHGVAGKPYTQGAKVTDVLPKGLQFVSATGGDGCTYASGSRTVSCDVPALDSKDTAVFTIVAQLDKPYKGERPLVNFARVDLPGDENPKNNEDHATTTLEPPPTMDFGIAKDGPEGPLDAGDTAIYTLTVTNHGKAGKLYTEGAKVTDALPPGLEFVSASGGNGCTFTETTRTVECEVPPLDSGETAVFTIDTTLAKPYKGPSPLVNKASVSLADDENPDNDQDEVTTKVVPPADAHAVPTLSQWSLIVLSLLLGWMTWRQFAGARRRS